MVWKDFPILGAGFETSRGDKREGERENPTGTNYGGQGLNLDGEAPAKRVYGHQLGD